MICRGLKQFLCGVGHWLGLTALSHTLTFPNELAHHVVVLEVEGVDGRYPLFDVPVLGLEVLQLDPALVPGLFGALGTHSLGDQTEYLQNETVKTTTMG